VIVGETLQLTATPRDANGNVLTNRFVSWTSGAPGLATVSSTGLVTGIVPGSAVIIASVDGFLGSAMITIRDVPVAAVTISPGSVGMNVGQDVSLVATARDGNGNPLPGRLMTWISSNPAVATVSAGVVTGVAIGSTTISAISEGQTGTATVNVTPIPVVTVEITPSPSSVTVGQSVQLTATPRGPNGAALTGRGVTWGSASPAVASVSSSGLLTGVSPGTAVIIATVDGVQGSSQATVTQIPVASVSVTPGAPSLLVGASVTLSAVTLDAGGNVLAGRPIAWASGDPTIATVAGGTVTAVSAGITTITATSEGKAGSATVTISTPPPAPVASVNLNPPSVSIDVGATTMIVATTLDASGNVLTGRVVQLTSADPAIATVDASGLVTGVAAGVTNITATSEGQSATASVTITALPPASVTIAPSPASVFVKWTTTLAATVRDANGAVIPGAAVSWSSSDVSVATISATGDVTGVTDGTATITATVGTISSTTTVTVQPAPVDRVVVTPVDPSILVFQGVQLTATLYDAQNNVLSGRSVSWSSADQSRVTVNSTGFAFGWRKGNAVITATSEGKSGTTEVRVR
jgi:uncharacterized protein YjdB